MNDLINIGDIISDSEFQELLNGRAELYGDHRVLNPEIPLESPIEYELERVLCKFIPDGARVQRQFKVPTYRGTFRLDLVVKIGDSLIGFEADGKEYHDWSRDIFRDAIILDKTKIEHIYRITGPDVYYRLETALLMLGRHDQKLFSQRGMDGLWALSECRDDLEFDSDEEGIYGHYHYVDEDSERHYRRVHVHCLSRRHANFYDMIRFAKERRDIKLEKLWSEAIVERMKQRTPRAGAGE